MNSKERVLKTIRHEEPDRVPMNIWMFRQDTQAKVAEKYGSLENFYDRYHIDIHMAITPPPCRTNPDYLEEKMNLTPESLNYDDWFDPDDPLIYVEIQDLVKKYGHDKTVFAHVWGCVESVYGFFGVQQTLLLMALEPEYIRELFYKASAFSERVSKNLLNLGIDVLHITGDVGSNVNMLFSPEMWREQVKAFDAMIIKPAKEKGIPISLHSCGYCMPIIPDWIEIGVDVLHPIQESAGMDMFEVKQKYGGNLTLHGGLDLRKLCKLKKEEVRDYIEPRMKCLKKGGGFIFNTGHTVQMDTSLDILEYAYDVAMEYSGY